MQTEKGGESKMKKAAILLTIMAGLMLAASPWAKAPAARAKGKKLQDKAAVRKIVPNPPVGAINVAVYDDSEYGPGEYFDGGDSNAWETIQYILNNDPQGRFNAVVVTDLSASTLAGFDVLSLPDNSVPEEFLSDVSAWFVPGKVIVCFDSAVSYAEFSGFFWPGYGGNPDDVGNGTLWGYGSCFEDGLISELDYVTDGYYVGQQVGTLGGDAEYFPEMLPPGTNVFLVANYGECEDFAAGRNQGGDRAILKAPRVEQSQSLVYGAYRDVAGHGRMVLLGPYDFGGEPAVQYEVEDAWPMICNAHLLPTQSGVDLNFYDDISGAAQFCVNTGSGIYEWDNYDWYYFYSGRAEIVNAGSAIWNGPTDPNFLYVVYNPVQLNAYGYFYDTENGIFSSLIDYDTTDSPFPCGGGGQPGVRR
jgi:hypothetical protein